MLFRSLLFLATLTCAAQPLIFGQASPLSGKVSMHNGRPTIFINDQPVSPQFYGLTHAYGARWSWEEIPARNLRNFCEQGFRLYQVDLYFEDIWYKNNDQLDIEKVQRQVRGVLDACPNAAVVIRVHVNAPYWWNEQNRDECTEYADGPVDTRSYGPPNDNENGDVDRPLRASLASLKWRTEAAEKLRQFCERLSSTPEGASVIGLHISCGVYGEWHYWGFIDHDPDTGPAMTKYFRNWLRSKYKTDQALQQAWKSTNFTLANATVPDLSERDTTHDGIFRSPENERRVIDYFKCQQFVVAEDIIEFSKVVKQHWPRPIIVGVFYNYFFMTFSRQAAGGHLEHEMILKTPYVDYLSAPQSYWGGARRPGGSGQARGLIESANLHGKLWLDEMDQNSHKGGPFNAGFLPTRDQDVGIIRRNLAQAMTRGAGYWFYDFGPYRSSGWWDDTLLLRDIKRIRTILDDYFARPFKREADVLFVYSNETFYFLKNRTTPISSYNILDQQSADAFRAGAVFDQIYITDLDKVQLDKYKTIVFSNTFVLSEAQKKFITDKVAKNKRTIVWNYMPGYINDKKADFSFLEKLTGFKLSKAGSPKKHILVSTSDLYPLRGEDSISVIDPFAYISDPKATTIGVDKSTREVIVARKQFKDHTAYLTTYVVKQPQVFRSIFRESGAHIYGDGDDVFHEGSGILMVHSKAGGEKPIALRNGKSVQLTMLPESTVYLDAATGAILLK
jgi:hypothetical protein